MAFYLYSSPSTLFHDRLSLCGSLSSPRKFRLGNVNHPLKLSVISRQFRSTLHISNVSLPDPVAQEAHNSNATEVANPQDPVGKSSSSSKSYIWVNPSSPRASQLRRKSYDSRYTNLVTIADTLNSCNPTEVDVFSILRVLGDKIVEQDAVVILNNMLNPENALLALKLFRSKMKLEREVILYNVTLKVFRMCKDMDIAEKPFAELIQFVLV